MAATPDQIEAIAANGVIPLRVRVLITLAWLTAARSGCARKPAKDDIVVNGDMSSVTFRRGKSVLLRGPCTVHTAVPQAWAPMVRDYITSSQPGRLFPTTKGADLRTALRTASPLLEQRSLRRGALLALSASGIKDAELLHFSGHVSVRMLHRYLGWGLHAKSLRSAMVEGARSAFQTKTPIAGAN